MDKFDELMKKSIIDSKNKFLEFVKGIYNIDECVFGHLINMPIISEYDENLNIVPSTLKSEEEIVEIFDGAIKKELGEKEICSINIENDVFEEFEYETIEELEQKIEKGEYSQDYNSIIVYNENKLREKFEEQLKEGIEKENVVSEYLNNLILTELCLLNSNYLTSVSRKNDKSLVSLAKNKKTLIEILILMIKSYKTGDSIEDCLYKVLETKINSKEKLDDKDKNIFGMYVVAYSEIVEWLIFGAYSAEFATDLNDKMAQIFDIDTDKTKNGFKDKILAYTAENNISEKQKTMLGMLGITEEEGKQMPVEYHEKNIFEAAMTKIKEIITGWSKRKKI